MGCGPTKRLQNSSQLNGGMQLKSSRATCPAGAPVVSTGVAQRRQLTDYAGVTPLANIVEDSVRPADSLTAMLTDQLATVHNAGMRLLAKASVTEGVDPMVKLTLAAARMLDSFHAGVLVLNRLRNGREQAAVVQNVNVAGGGQAIVAGSLEPHAKK